MSRKDIVVPAAGESVTEADIASWYKADGDFVEMDEAIVELETDKASMDLAAEASGILSITIQDGTTVNVGDVIGYITESAEAPVPKTAPEPEAPAEPKAQATSPAPQPAAAPPAPATTTPANAPKFVQQATTHATGHPSPSAARVMAEKGLNADQLSGTGPGGRITKQDADAATAKPTAPVATPSQTIDPSQRNTRREPMSRLRKTVMRRLVEVQHTGALLTTFNEVDMSAIMAIRKSYKEAFKEKYNIGLGFMSFFTKAVSQALLEFPVVNASVDGEDIVYHDFCDISIAVSTPKGLVVPVIRNAESLAFHEIEATIKDFALKGKEGKISMADMEGGTFTITNGGTFGSMLSTPIINAPQSAILGMHNIVERPVAVNGQVEIRPIMYVALTYDHRIIDGADSVRFLVKVKELLEDPTRLLISL